jgi:hypothetical protein
MWIAATVVVLLGVGVVAIIAVRNDPTTAVTSVGDTPHFVDESATAGIEHSYEGEFEHFVGGGVAAFDCDDDGRVDLFFAGGSSPAALYRNLSAVGGEVRFKPLPSPVTDLVAVTGAYPLDINSDGHQDLAVLRRGDDVVLFGTGDCRFEEANEQMGIDGGADWTTAFSATWEASSVLPTLAFGSYLQPEADRCADSRLVRPGADGTVYGPPVALTPGYCTLSMLFSDWSRSGRADLRLANDRHYYTDGSEQLFRVAPGETPRAYTDADGWTPLQLWGMGIASQDVTDDGYPEVFITSQGDNKLQTLDAGPAAPTYRDIALRRGVTAQRPFVGGDVLPSTAWHPEFEDVNNDGYVDLFITKGNVEAQTDHAMRDPNNLLIAQADGTFEEQADTAGVLSYEGGRGASLVDLNLDGLLDIVVVNRESSPSVWRNVGRGDETQTIPMGHWLAIELGQSSTNVDAVGAWVEVRAGDRSIIREVTVGGGHAGGKIGWIHAGLGDAEEADIRIHWPDGEVDRWTTVDADQFLRIERGGSDPTPWEPTDALADSPEE